MTLITRASAKAEFMLATTRVNKAGNVRSVPRPHLYISSNFLDVRRAEVFIAALVVIHPFLIRFTLKIND